MENNSPSLLHRALFELLIDPLDLKKFQLKLLNIQSNSKIARIQNLDLTNMLCFFIS